jgi:hypothetical protein
MDVGITLHIKDSKTKWINGLSMNALNLCQCLNQIKGVNAYIVDTGKIEDYSTLSEWDHTRYPIKKFKNVFNDKKLKLLIMLGTSIPTGEVEKFKSVVEDRKVVKYQCGNNYVIDMERAIFQNVEGAPSWESGHDQTWMVPQQEVQNKEYFRIIYNQKPEDVKVVPFVWDSYHIEVSRQLYIKQAGKDCRYSPGTARKDKNLLVMEPNLNVLKYAMIPMLAAEDLYRRKGNEGYGLFIVASGDRLMKNDYHRKCLLKLDLNSSNPYKIQYLKRRPVTQLLAEFTSVVVSHQWENPLNYAYLDALYFGYPLVHNAPMVKDLGYYYEGFNAGECATQIDKALSSHDNDFFSYVTETHQKLKRYTPTNEKVVEHYRKLLENLFEPGKHDLGTKYNYLTNTVE